MPSRSLAYAVLIIIATTCLSCGEDQGDTDILPEPDEQSIDTYIISGPSDGSVWKEPKVTFQCMGSKNVTEFAYRCLPIQENWSEWSSNTSISLEYLDQGKYVFEVIGRTEPGNEDNTPAQRDITIDIPGPGILLKPFKHQGVLGQQFSIELLADDVDKLMLARVTLKFNPAFLKFIDAVPGAIFRKKPSLFFAKLDTQGGVIDINVSTIDADPVKIKGTGSIATISFNPLSVGEGNIDIGSESEFRDSAGMPINISSRIGSVIDILED